MAERELLVAAIPLLVPIIGAAVFFVLSKLARRRRNPRQARWFAISGVLCLLTAAYLLACAWANFQEVDPFWKAQDDLSRKIAEAARQHAYNHHAQDLPARWLGEDIEPMFTAGYGPPQPYAYLPIHDINNQTGPRRWVAYTPAPLKRHNWWALWKPIGDFHHDRVVAWLDHGATGMSESDFQRGFAEQLALPIPTTAPAPTSSPASAPTPSRRE